MYFSKDGNIDELELDPNIVSLFEEISDAKRTAQFPLKVVINKQKTKVLFAVADCSFADVLSSFLMLPLGTIVRILKEHYGDDNAPVFGSLGTLYKGVANLDSAHFEAKLCKHMLLNPRNSSDLLCQTLPLNIDDSPWLPLSTFDPSTLDIITSFIISDDLRILPQIGGLIQTLANHGISDIDGVELCDVSFGFNEIMDILRESVLSHTLILTKVVLNGKQTVSATKSDPSPVLLSPVLLSHYQVVQNEATYDSKKVMILRTVVQKSTNNFLFAQADKKFVDFLLSFLTIPLGEVVHLLENNTCLKGMDNLYRSLKDLIDLDDYLQFGTIDMLIEPKLAPGYLSRNQILPLREDRINFRNKPIVKEMNQVKGEYVSSLELYMVTDDLTVTPYCITNAISIINGMDIALSDVKEVALEIGLAEALSLLKASLTSTRALSNGLRCSLDTAEARNCKTEDGKADGLELDPKIVSLFEEISDAKRTAQFLMKVLINRQQTKVLFAVTDDFFADVLLSFLTLPLGTIVRVLKEHYGDDKAPVFGSLGTLYEGVANLDSGYFETQLCKHMLLNPRNSSDIQCQSLRLNIDDSPWEQLSAAGDPFTRNLTSFIIYDDLRMVPQIGGGLMQTLASHGIADLNGVELRDVTLGFNEIMDILRESVLSNTSILTKVVLNDKKMVSETKSDTWDVLLSHYPVAQNEATSGSEKIMILRAVIRKSTNEFLFAESDEDFVDFLLSFLAIPLGEVVRLLENNTCFKSMDNLHRSLTEFIDFHKYLQVCSKDKLIEPKLAAGYLSRNQILPLREENKHTWYRKPMFSRMCKVNGKYVRRLETYMVTDYLTVTPYCITNAISIIKGMDIPLSDVKEVDLNIGLAEALRLLKASLTSTRALSNGLRLQLDKAKACNIKTEK